MLEAAGFLPYVPVNATDFADPAKRAEWVRDKGMIVFSLRPRSGVPMVDLTDAVALVEIKRLRVEER